MTRHFYVVGSPISHSLSPFIHRAFAESLNIDLTYTARDVGTDEFVRVLDAFRDAGVVGVNVTLPHKEAAFAYAQRHDRHAVRAGAANTLAFVDDGAVGYNTDGGGLVTDIEVRWQHPLAGRRVLILGAGGAVRGILGPLIDAGVAEIVIANRTQARAEALAGEFATEGVHITAAPLPWTTALADSGIDTVINAASAGHQSRRIESLIHERALAGAWCYDLSYGSGALLRPERCSSARCCIDGLGMLVEQAALAFEIWLGERPETEPVYQQLRVQLDHG